MAALVGAAPDGVSPLHVEHDQDPLGPYIIARFTNKTVPQIVDVGGSDKDDEEHLDDDEVYEEEDEGNDTLLVLRNRNGKTNC